VPSLFAVFIKSYSQMMIMAMIWNFFCAQFVHSFLQIIQSDDDDYGDDLEFLLCSVCSQFSSNHTVRYRSSIPV
jgi:hypothetical protein